MFEMLGNIIKNLSEKPSTRMYPFEKRKVFENSRGHISGIDINKCIFCGICSRKCPSDAIVVDKNSKRWEIDNYKCIICGLCVEACPKKCINMDSEYKTSSYSKAMEKFSQEELPPSVPLKGGET